MPSNLFLYHQAREEYRLEKYRKKVEWAVAIIQRQYVQWKVQTTPNAGCEKEILIILFFALM